MTDQRLSNEIAHGKFLKDHGAAEIWNWESPAGKRRYSRRVAMLSEGITPQMKVLEVGCGIGLFTRAFAATGCRITAIDISPDLLEVARASVQGGNVAFRQENAYELSFPSGAFDAVIGSSVLHHLDVDRALGEFFRVLVPGGRLAFTEPNMMNPQIFLQKNIPALKKAMGDSPDETAFFRRGITRQLQRFGFTDIRVEPFDFLHPGVPQGAVNGVEKFGAWCERMPVIRQIAGSLHIRARKPV